MEIAKGGRARFTIENRNFNEQKNRGYQSTHNFGHFGNLPAVFFGLTQIAHSFAQLFRAWKTGRKLIDEIGSERRFFERLAVLLSCIPMPESLQPILYIKLAFDSG